MSREAPAPDSVGEELARAQSRAVSLFAVIEQLLAR